MATTTLKHINGSTVRVDSAKAERLVDSGLFTGDVKRSQPEGYAAMKVADLKAEIERRNDGRDEDDLLSVEGKKADLVAVLEADDEADDDGE